MTNDTDHQERRRQDVVSSAVVAVALIAGSTLLAALGRITGESCLVAWTIAAAVAGVPIAFTPLKRRNGDDRDS